MAGPGGTFFGLIVKPNKRYDTTVKETFRVTKACLEPATHAGKTTSLHVEVDSEEYIIANFDSKHLNEPLDLGFTKGETISFKVEGPGVVHVTGNIMEEDDEDMMDGMMMDDESEEEEMPELVAGKRKNGAADASPAKKVKTSQPVNGTEDSSNDDDDDDDDDDDSSSEEGADTSLGDLDDTANFAEEEESDDDSDGDDDDDDSSEEESPAKAPVLNGKAKKLNGSVKETPTKKGDAIAALKKNKDEKTPKKDTPAAETKTPKQEGKSPKKEAKTPKQDGKTPKETKTPKEGKTPKQDVKTPNAKTPKQEASAAVATPKSVKKTMKGGIAIEEIKEGTGPEAKSGRVVGMFYSGRLKSNNKQFDACQSGKPFKFKLGKGEVIKGWDIGVQGLKVGGKRKLTIPPQMGYGSAGAPPDIPPNSTLVFEVECKYVN